MRGKLVRELVSQRVSHRMATASAVLLQLELTKAAIEDTYCAKVSDYWQSDYGQFIRN